MALTPGTRVGSYEVILQIGAGGMGEVYRARDTKLNRDVALKILPDAFTLDGDRTARFRREAQVLASLNHPNIAAIHGFEDSGSTHALVLELVDGPTLADRIATGPIPFDEALPIATQIAEALEAAHEKGIIHRDLKPANIKVRADGAVKVLDFGLAKALAPAGVSEIPADIPDTPTVTSPAMTQRGLILGTAAYMAPEQAKGGLADKRSDLWAFGCVLYEMLTRRRAFAADDVSETLARVLTAQPDWDALPAATPASVQRLLRRCLEKDRRRRLDSAAAARLDLEDAISGSTDVAVARRAASPGLVAALVVGAIAATTAIVWPLRRTEQPRPASVVRFAIVPPSGQEMSLWPERPNVALSPDGRYVVYPGVSGLFLRALDRLDAQLLPGTLGGYAPFFSPNGRWIGFFQAGDLKKMTADGGPVISIARGLTAPISATWGDDDTIVFTTELSQLSRVAAAGGQPELLKAGLRFPFMLPGAKAVLCTRWTEDDAQISALNLRTREVKTLVRGGVDATYVKTGHLLYRAKGTLFIVPFDLARLEVTGEPQRIGDALANVDSYALSAAGTLAVLPIDTRRSLVWVDRSGRETPTGAPTRPYETMKLSPDGTRVALLAGDERTTISVWDFMRETLTRLAIGVDVEWVPMWTPDGRRIVYTANRTGAFNLYVRNADGSGSEQRLTTSEHNQVPNSVLPDGTAALAAELFPTTGWDIIKVALSPAGPETLVSTSAAEFAANISPDGRYFAYNSYETGRSEICVRRYPDAARGQWQISTGGGNGSVWARSGRELFYLDAETGVDVLPVQGTRGGLMSVDIDTSGPDLKVGKPTRLITTKYLGWFYSYDVSPDGRRFLFIKEPQTTNSIVVIVNWQEELKQRVPTK